MSKIKAVLLCFVCFFMLFVSGCDIDDDNDSDSPAAPAKTADKFPKQVTVFDIPVKATDKVSDAKLLHAASVMAEYLDNNEDGVPDNQDVVDKMVELKAVLMMFENEAEIKTVFSSEADFPEHGQDLYAEETHPGGSTAGAFDATLEEVLHLVTHEGYSNVYPDALGEEGGSDIADAMDKARGGHFDDIPASYPPGAWYTYDDDTCDYSCQVTEYTYWALTSMLGAQDYPGRLAEIQDEWKLNTKALVQTNDPDVHTILTDHRYALPDTLPDGTYAGSKLSIIRN